MNLVDSRLVYKAGDMLDDNIKFELFYFIVLYTYMLFPVVAILSLTRFNFDIKRVNTENSLSN